MENQEHRRIWHAWHEASVNRNQDALLSLYAEDAVLESPMVPTVLNQASGIIRGRDNIGSFLRSAGARSSGLSTPRTPMHWWRDTRIFSTEDTLIWEYPRETPDGDQIDIVEVMQIDGGLIHAHRVYWGWKLVSALNKAL